MSSFRKIPQADAFTNAARYHASRAIDHLPSILPASLVDMEGRIATVQIEADSPVPIPRLRVPLLESEYIRAPLQPGCLGMVIPAHLTLGLMTGLGIRRPAMGERPGNFSACVFVPLSHAAWEKLNGQFLNLYGVEGVQLTPSLNHPHTVRLTHDAITLSTGSAQITLSSGTVSITGDLVINGQEYKAHTHSNGHNGAPTGGILS